MSTSLPELTLERPRTSPGGLRALSELVTPPKRYDIRVDATAGYVKLDLGLGPPRGAHALLRAGRPSTVPAGQPRQPGGVLAAPSYTDHASWLSSASHLSGAPVSRGSEALDGGSSFASSFGLAYEPSVSVLTERANRAAQEAFFLLQSAGAADHAPRSILARRACAAAPRHADASHRGADCAVGQSSMAQSPARSTARSVRASHAFETELRSVGALIDRSRAIFGAVGGEDWCEAGDEQQPGTLVVPQHASGVAATTQQQPPPQPSQPQQQPSGSSNGRPLSRVRSAAAVLRVASAVQGNGVSAEEDARQLASWVRRRSPPKALTPAAREVRLKLELARESATARARLQDHVAIVRASWGQRHLIPPLSVQDLQGATQPSHLTDGGLVGAALLAAARDFTAENSSLERLSARTDAAAAARAARAVRRIDERTGAAMAERERLRAEKMARMHAALVRHARMREERQREEAFMADRARMLAIVSVLVLGARTAMLVTRFSHARHDRGIRAALGRLQGHFRARKLRVAFGRLLKAIDTFRRLALQIPIKLKLWKLRNSARALRTWLREVVDVRPVRRALHTLRWTVLRLQRWWRSQLVALQAWVQVAVLAWERFERASGMEHVSWPVKASILLEDWAERRRAFVELLDRHRRALALREHARGTAAFYMRRRAALGGTLGAAWAAKLAERRAHEHVPGVDEAASPARRRRGKRGSDDSAGGADGAKQLPAGSPARRGSQAEQSRRIASRRSSKAPAAAAAPSGGSSKSSLGAAARRQSLSAARSSSGAGGSATRKASSVSPAARAHALPTAVGEAPALPILARLHGAPERAWRGTANVPFRVSLKPRNGLVAVAAREVTNVTMRMFGEGAMEKHAVAVQRVVRGHQLRRTIRLDALPEPGALPEPPHWRSIPSLERLPRFVSRARARMRHARADGEERSTKRGILLLHADPTPKIGEDDGGSEIVDRLRSLDESAGHGGRRRVSAASGAAASPPKSLRMVVFGG
ncbi:hypothetical protein KFE25_002950 [Diacronema lutheri]|uniref:Uncharacterized protein n=1 Tax=Diacronema lutheri TaxID=2081491 RepID=A0A8J5XJA9_DIALT|nr:hypothetical protein KFE25_002950 [Diacronema lutheri]